MIACRLTSQAKAATSWLDIKRLVDVNEMLLNHIHLAAMLSRLAKLYGGHRVYSLPKQEQQGLQELIRVLVSHVCRVLGRRRGFMC